MRIVQAVLRLFPALLQPQRESDDVEDADDAEVVDAELIEELPYRVRDDFLSPAEFAFFTALVTAIGDRCVICPKVRLGDVLFCSGRTNFWRHTNRVNQKHVDFLICGQRDGKPLFAVELDDRSHLGAIAKERDAFKDAAFNASGLPLVRVRNQRTWDATSLQRELTVHLEAREPIAYLTPADDAVPTCVKCGLPMKLRTAKRGTQAGNQFYGCPNFPRCREMQSVGR